MSDTAGRPKKRWAGVRAADPRDLQQRGEGPREAAEAARWVAVAFSAGTVATAKFDDVRSSEDSGKSEVAATFLAATLDI